MKDVTERIVEAIVALVFGIVITVVAVAENAGAAIIVLGALLIAVGVGCLVWAYIDKNKIKKIVEFIKADYQARIDVLTAERDELVQKTVEQANVIADLQGSLDVVNKKLLAKDTEIKALKVARKAEEPKKETAKKTVTKTTAKKSNK